LKALASDCDFCFTIYDCAKTLEKDDTLSYCRRHWGKLYEKALEQAPIHIYLATTHGEHNITWECSCNVSGLEGYERGPKGFQIYDEFGGLYVDEGKPLPLYISQPDFLMERQSHQQPLSSQEDTSKRIPQ